MDRARLLVLGMAVLLAGCAANEPASDAANVQAPRAAEAASLRIEAEGCSEGGAYVTWNAVPDDPGLPRGFDTRDVSADVGNPPTTSIGGNARRLHTPAESVPGENVTGAYHPLMRCATWTMDGVAKTDLWVAWVAALVHPPTYDPAPLAREYSVGALAVNDADLADALRRAGIEPELLTVTDFALDDTAMRTAFAFDHHGVIYAEVPMRSLGAKSAETARWWVVASVPDVEYRPVALDIIDEGGMHLVASAPGAFEHNVEGPAPVAIVPVHTFSTWALGYTGVSRTIVLGPVVDVIVDGQGHAH